MSADGMTFATAAGVALAIKLWIARFRELTAQAPRRTTGTLSQSGACGDLSSGLFTCAAYTPGPRAAPVLLGPLPDGSALQLAWADAGDLDAVRSPEDPEHPRR